MQETIDGAIVVTSAADDFLPVMSVKQAVERYRQFGQFVQNVLVEGRDYGAIPGTNKNTLLKAGAEKLCSLFGYATRFVCVERVEDWTGTNYNGEPFFYYLYRCQLWRGDRIIAEGEGSCNSWESKYRYRKSERVCPNCGQSTIIKGKAEYGGGWVCFQKRGGCGAKFPEGDQSIEGQALGRVPNPDISDMVNTIQKMAQKRALVAAALIGTNASDYFTQDLEDFSEPEPPQLNRPQSQPKAAHTPPRTRPQKREPSREKMLARIADLGGDTEHASTLDHEDLVAYGKELSAATSATTRPEHGSYGEVTGHIITDTIYVNDKVCRFDVQDKDGDATTVVIFPQRSIWWLVVNNENEFTATHEDVVKIAGKWQIKEGYDPSLAADVLTFLNEE